MHLKIWHKMIIGISIPAFIAVLGGFITFRYVMDIESRQGFVQIADDLKEHVLELRRNEKNFLHYKNEEYLQHVKNTILILERSIGSISAETARELGEQDYSVLQKSIQVYPDLINMLFANYQQEASITEHVRSEGRKLEEFATKGNHAPELSTSYILNLRRLEKNFMLFRDKKSFDELNEGLSQLKSLSPSCTECTSYIEALLSLFDTYNKSNSLEKYLQLTGRKLEETTGRIVVRERQRIGSFLAKTKRLLFIALILLFTLGPLFVYTTATYIAAPIKRLAAITRKISEGDTSLRAPLKEHDETLTLAESFNTMLDHLELTHKSLEESMRLLKEKQAQLVESEKRASLGLLVSGVAHELNNPLNNIFLSAETMIEDLKDMTKEEQRNYILDILAQSERAQHIVENLLDFARARRSTEMEELNVIKIVQDSIALIANQLRINNIILDADIPDTEITVKGNLSKLEQILINIILNAIQAMKGGGTLDISVKPDDEQRNVRIEIVDTGPGIREEDLKNIFEPFFTTKTVGEGTGLGLSVSYSLVKEHDGDIEVESTVGRGTKFTVILPIHKKQS